jgi:hypothetical protein
MAWRDILKLRRQSLLVPSLDFLSGRPRALGETVDRRRRAWRWPDYKKHVRAVEARFGRALHDCGVTPVYEHAIGVGETSVDFAFGGWNVELLSFDETDAAKAATR